jgi:hypothetical protein
MRTGYAIWTSPDTDAPSLERDTVSCGHCGRVVFVKPGTASTVYLIPTLTGWREDPGAGCRLCMKPVCLPCERMGRCLPLERQLEQLEQR